MQEPVTTSEPENGNPAGLKPGTATHSGLRIEAAGIDKAAGLCALVSHRFFTLHGLEFVAVPDGERVLGLCARRQIGIVLGFCYGFALFSGSPVREHLAPEALVIRSGDSIHQILKRVSR
jgi:hypothetical protein